MTSGTIYLLHFDRPYKHARHYTGFATDLSARLAQHDQGHGARLLEVVKAAGISWCLARTWQGTRHRERQIKNQGGASRFCPECGIRPQPDRPRPPRTPQEVAGRFRELFDELWFATNEHDRDRINAEIQALEAAHPPGPIPCGLMHGRTDTPCPQ